MRPYLSSFQVSTASDKPRTQNQLIKPDMIAAVSRKREREQEEMVGGPFEEGGCPAHDALACLPGCSPSLPSLLFYSSVEMESIPGKIWSKSAPDLAFSMRCDFLS